MTVPAPPALATWLLQRVVPGKNKEALAGDLLEEFHRRGSVAWYWRQVLGAMFAGFSKQLRSGWSGTEQGMVWTFGFVTLWTCVVPAYQQLIFRSFLFRSLGGWMSIQPRSAWPIYEYGVDLAVSAVMVATGVFLYLTITRRFDLWKFFRGFLVGLFVVVACQAMVPLFIETHLLFVSRLVWRFGWGLYDGAAWLPLSLGVQLSVWAARSNRPQWKHETET